MGRNATLAWVLSYLVCPACRRGLIYVPDDESGIQGILRHDSGSCREAYPVIDEIPRLIVSPHRAALYDAYDSWFSATEERRRLGSLWRSTHRKRDDVVAGFDFEWSRFARVGTPELTDVFHMYFDLVGPADFREDAVVLDAGCGAGRWALEVARRGPRVVAMDLGRSIEIARENTQRTQRVACVQADLADLPLRPGSVDWVYTLGVLHHLRAPDRAMAQIGDAVRPGGFVVAYLYYALEDRGPIFHALFGFVTLMRSLTSRLPRRFVYAFAWVMAVLVYWPLARLARTISRFGLRRVARWLPLSFYADRSFTIMLNDSLDRFGTPVERRYTREGITGLLRNGGFGEVSFSPDPPYWHAVAWKRSGAISCDDEAPVPTTRVGR